jgi:protein-disulfide isomerase
VENNMPFDISFDQSIADQICKRIAAGRELRDVCTDKGMPSLSKVMEWSALHPVFQKQLTQAAEQMLDSRAAQAKHPGFSGKMLNNLAVTSEESAAMNHQMDVKVAEAYAQVSALSIKDARGCLALIAGLYTVLLLFALNSHLNFLPSQEWMIISAALGLFLGAICGPSLVNSGIARSTPSNSVLSALTRNSAAILLSGFCFYSFITYTIGPAVTALYGITIEKNINGTTEYNSSSHGPHDYYVDIQDLPETPLAKIYISKDEYGGTSRAVGMHVVFKQSFFGLTAERYTFTSPLPALPGQIPAAVDISTLPAFKTNIDDIYNNPATPTAGNPYGDVTIVEYFDYRCVYCKITEPKLTRLLQEDNNIKLVYKNFPKLGPLSTMLATATLASLRQGTDKYAKFRDALFSSHVPAIKNQEELYQLAGSLGLDIDKLKQDMGDPAITAQIQHDIAVGKSIGVQITPTFIINGYLSPGMAEYGYLREMVSYVRAVKSAATTH